MGITEEDTLSDNKLRWKVRSGLPHWRDRSGLLGGFSRVAEQSGS
jgi:hypothetical protein